MSRQKKSIRRYIFLNMTAGIITPYFLISILIIVALSQNFYNSVVNDYLLSVESISNEVSMLLGKYEQAIESTSHFIDNMAVSQDNIQELLNNYIEEYQYFERIEVLNKEGHIQYVSPYRSDYIGLDMSNRHYYKSSEDIQWSDVYIARYSGHLTINVSKKVNNRTFIGYIALNNLENILARYEKYDIRGRIVDGKGDSILSTLDIEYYTKQEGNIRDDITYYESKDYSGNAVLVAHHTLDIFDWTIELVVLKRKVLLPYYFALGMMVLVLGIVLIVFIIILRTFLKRILRSIGVLNMTSKKMADGNYDVVVQDTDFQETNQLANNFNIMARKIEERDHELRQFVYIASHDLQEPLRMVTSYMQILEKRYNDKLDEKGRRYIYYAVDGAIRMKKLVQDLLNYSRLGREYNFKEDVDLNLVFDEAKRNLKIIIEENDATIHIEPLPKVYGDEEPLRQLAQNLIGNAIKYRKKDQPVIHVRASEHETYWEIEVADNGIGIKEEFLDVIFQVFKRLHTRDEYAGTGIGLAICKKVISKHNGAIYAKSEVGVGTTFYFRLPKKGGDN